MLPLEEQLAGAVDVDCATRVDAQVTAATPQGDAVPGGQVHLPLHRLHADVLLCDQVQQITVGFDFQRSLARDQAHAVLLSEQGNASVGVGRELLGGG